MAGKKCGVPQLVRFSPYILLLLAGIFHLSVVRAQPDTPLGTTSKIATANVELKTFNREFRLDGVVEAINKATISAQTSGTISAILVDVDDYVKKGSLILRLNDTSQQAQLKKALARKKEAQSHLANATEEYKRISDIYAKKVVSKAKMDNARYNLSAAKARLDAAQASLSEAREQLSYTRVVAPYSGIVTARQVEVGEAVRPGTKLMTGISLDKLRININVPQSLITTLRHYAKAFVSIHAPVTGKLIHVTVKKITIFPVADPRTGTFKVRLDLPEGIKGLFPGMFIKVALVTGEKKVLMVPSKSVVYRSEVTAVYVVGSKGEINFRYIRPGRTRDGLMVVLSGLQSGEQVALDPIQAGARLIAQRQRIISGAD